MISHYIGHFFTSSIEQLAMGKEASSESTQAFLDKRQAGGGKFLVCGFVELDFKPNVILEAICANGDDAPIGAINLVPVVQSPQEEDCLPNEEPRVWSDSVWCALCNDDKPICNVDDLGILASTKIPTVGA